MIQIFIRDPPGDPQDSHWRPPRFSLETQNFCFKPPIFIGNLKIFIEDPKYHQLRPKLFVGDSNIFIWDLILFVLNPLETQRFSFENS